MSTPQQPPAQPSGGGGNVFTRKVGPLSMWVWMLIALVLAIAYYLYKKNSTSASNSSTANAAAGNAPGGVDSSLVPQFINQDYIQETPPSAPNITVNNTLPTPPPPAPPPTTTPPPPPNPGGTNKPPPQTGGTKPPPKKTTTTPTTTTVTVGKYPTGAGGSPSASANSFGPGTAAWNSTLWGIAQHYNVKGGAAALAKLNNISNPNLIYPGQKIKVPT